MLKSVGLNSILNIKYTLGLGPDPRLILPDQHQPKRNIVDCHIATDHELYRVVGRCRNYYVRCKVHRNLEMEFYTAENQCSRVRAIIETWVGMVVLIYGRANSLGVRTSLP
jgi:hypothetical protein